MDMKDEYYNYNLKYSSLLYHNYGTIKVPAVAYDTKRIRYIGTPEELFAESEWDYVTRGLPDLEEVFSTFHIIVENSAGRRASSFTASVDKVLTYTYDADKNQVDLQFEYTKITGTEETSIGPIISHIVVGPSGHLALFVEGDDNEVQRMLTSRYKQFYHAAVEYRTYDIQRIVRNYGVDPLLNPIEFTICHVLYAHPDKLFSDEDARTFRSIVAEYIQNVYGLDTFNGESTMK